MDRKSKKWAWAWITAVRMKRTLYDLLTTTNLGGEWTFSADAKREARVPEADLRPALAHL